ncbi:DMT family transporter [Ciceribacter thiooxidans]|uniref:DMT family transporter n=1 Tax=Ciceribacter thiooxidans TaxID=1969821 RepID=A0ABV7I4R0_9HYPH|nr:DMT family transporter [Ciceribacter thiooxidans]
MKSTAALTLAAMIAFAANSLLARLALGAGSIDAASYTALRIISGAAFLFFFISRRSGPVRMSEIPGNWIAATALFAYAIAFSLSYLMLGAATGALILFSSVQATMVGYSLARGDSLSLRELAGFTIAFLAFVYLILPGVGRPDLTGSVLMVISGISWGVYTLKGRGSTSPLRDTAGNFLRASAFCLPLALYPIWGGTASASGVLLALASGVVASGLGYSIWYRALTGLTTFQAALVQLSVPVIAAFGAIVFLNEALTARFAIVSPFILGGIAFAIVAKQKRHV